MSDRDINQEMPSGSLQAPEIILDNLLNNYEFFQKNFTKCKGDVLYFRQALFKEDIEEAFKKNWASHLNMVLKTKRRQDINFSESDIKIYAGTAFNLVSAIDSVYIANQNKYLNLIEDRLIIPSEGFAQEPLPSSKFREHLGFNEDDFAILHANLRHTPCMQKVGNEKKKKFWEKNEKGFYEQETVANMVDYIFDDVIHFRE